MHIEEDVEKLVWKQPNKYIRAYDFDGALYLHMKWYCE